MLLLNNRRYGHWFVKQNHSLACIETFSVIH